MTSVKSLVAIGLGVAATDAIAEHRTLLLSIENVECSACAASPERAVEDAKGVLVVELDAAKRRLMVTYDDTVTDWRDIAAAVADAGYETHRVADAPVVAIPTLPPQACVPAGAPSRRDRSLGVIHGRILRIEKGCVAMSRP